MTIMNKESSKTPKCGRCRNHGIVEDLKSHKASCKFKDCKCEKCILNVYRRDVMMAQSVLKKEIDPDVRARSRCSTASDSSTGSRSKSPRRLSPLAVHSTTSLIPMEVSEEEIEDSSHAVLCLMKHFGLEWEIKALPFAHAVYRMVGNISAAIKLVEEAQKEFRQLPEPSEHEYVPNLQPERLTSPVTVSSSYLPLESGPIPLIIDSPRRARFQNNDHDDGHYINSSNRLNSRDDPPLTRF